MFHFNCPYCNKEIVDDLFEYDLYSEEDNHMECPHCGKVITIHSSVIVDVWASECKCQLEDHEFELQKSYPECCSRMVCKHCGTERRLTDEEREKYGIGTLKEYIESLNEIKD